MVVGAAGVWLGYPIADPIIGLLSTLAIFGIVWQSAKAVFTRMLDGVEPSLVEEIEHAAKHVDAVKEVRNVRARWLGHRLTTEIDVAVAKGTTVEQADAISTEVEELVADHVPALASAHVRVRALEPAATVNLPSHSGHHHAPAPVAIKDTLVEGTIELVDTPDGERMQFSATRLPDDARVSVVIARRDGDEKLLLVARGRQRGVYMSVSAPAEPHEFDARLIVSVGNHEEAVPFRMVEPEDHVRLE